VSGEAVVQIETMHAGPTLKDRVDVLSKRIDGLEAYSVYMVAISKEFDIEDYVRKPEDHAKPRADRPPNRTELLIESVRALSEAAGRVRGRPQVAVEKALIKLVENIAAQLNVLKGAA